MKEAAVFLLDLYPTRNFAGQLQKLLDSIPDLRAHVFRVADTPQPASPAEWSQLLRDINPSAILLLWPSKRAAEACQILPQLKAAAPQSRVVAVTEADDQKGILEVLKAGADNAIALKLEASGSGAHVLSFLHPRDDDKSLVSSLKQAVWQRNLIGQSSTFIEEVKSIPLLARCNATVLITGETGTGKELCARAIHYLSNRTGKPFVAINCGAIPTDLVENELFGHERGAFTGAATSQQGLVGEAEGGTLMLDEIDSLPLIAQVKVLRFLQEKEYRPLGSSRVRQADVRVIAATNSNLEEAVSVGRLRQDLYYRLSVLTLRMPALRERREDIPLLAKHFLKKYSQEFESRVDQISPDALTVLMAHQWPGNVRELEHVIERATIFARGRMVTAGDIKLAGHSSAPAEQSLQEAKAGVVASFEKAYIQTLLAVHKGNITRAAEAAKKNRRAFFELLRKHDIDATKFKAGLVNEGG
ncbi:MAG TPA: sigma-54 dependent transcriptional regulator [Blastocatellia bacterium]|nr:sigma-54 dependent transcriptional regulator [Blastocatellia bacterium]